MTKKILLVDDDMRFREAIAPVLESKGYHVIESTNGKEAKIELSAGPFDLLIVDGTLPDTEGITLIAELRAGGNTSKIMFVSAFWRDTKTYHHLTKELSVSLVLHKPVLPLVLGDHVEKLIGPATAPDSGVVSPRAEQGGVPGLPRATATSALAQKLQSIGALYAKELPGELDEVAALIEAAKSAKDPVSGAGAVARKAHMLRGSAGTYGYYKVSEAMGRIEDSLKRLAEGGYGVWLTETWPDIDGALSEARQAAGEAVPDDAILGDMPSPVSGSSHVSASVAIELAGGQSTAGLIQALWIGDETRIDLGYLKKAGLVFYQADAVSWTELAGSHNFAAVFMEAAEGVGSPWGQLHQLRAMPGYQNLSACLVAVDGCKKALTGRDVHAGFSRKLTAPCAGQLIALTLDEMIAASPRQSPKVVIFDDDPSFIRRVEVVLGHEGFGVHGFKDTVEIREVLQEIKPDLVLLDVDMNGICGFDVCRMLRSTPDWNDLPVIFVTARTSWETRVSAFESGGDEYLSKPIVNAELLCRVRSRIERTRLLRDRDNKDTLTGLPFHTPAAQMMNRAIGEALEQNLSLPVVLLKLSGLPEINEKYGPMAGDHVLRSVGKLLMQRFRPQDLRGRWGGSSFVLAFPGVNKATAGDAIALLLAELQSLSFVGHGGLTFAVRAQAAGAVSPDDGAGIYPLIEKAEQRLSRNTELSRSPAGSQS